MKNRLIACLLLSSIACVAQADYLDVIAFKLRPACSMADFQQLNKQMNDWGKKYGLRSEVVVPIYSDVPYGVAWIGRNSDATSGGKAWDAWRTARDAGEEPVKSMNARWTECTEISYRRAFDTY